MQALKQGVDVVIGTPGRILDMTNRNLVSLPRVEYLVLDEADQMLDAGFAPDIERMLGMTYAPQTVLASATMPEWVTKMIAKHLHDPLRVKVAADGPSLLEHGLIHTNPGTKLRVLSQILHQHRGAIVFGRTKHGVRKLNRDLLRLGHKSVELQGNMAQNARDHVMASFRNQVSDVLVATNLAARGLDMSHVSLVINYELPDTAEALTHRVGRTARNGKTGRALTFITEDDGEKWAKLRRQGAPAIRPVDASALAAAGDWMYVAETTPAAHAPGAGAGGVRPQPSRGRRSRPRRWQHKPAH